MNLTLSKGCGSTIVSLCEQGKPMQQACHIAPKTKRYSVKAVDFQCAAYKFSSLYYAAVP